MDNSSGHHHGRSNSDPLLDALRAQHADESLDQRHERLRREAAAKKISDAIDEQLRAEEKARAKKRTEVKILLLGQSESGKSTTLKQFQMLYSPNAFALESPAWRPIVYLNLVRSIRRILEALTFSELEDDDYEPTSPSLSSSPDGTIGWNRGQFAEVRQRLTPLLDLEEKLISVLASPEASPEEDEATQLMPNTNGSAPLPDNYIVPEPQSHMVTPPRFDTRKEVFVRSQGGSSGWKKAFGKLGGGGGKNKKGHAEPVKGAGENWASDPDDPVHILFKCKGDMIRLWEDPGVQSVLKKRKLRLEESSGFYLNDIERVTAHDYIPSVDDVLRARLKTLGVIEHRFTLERGHEKGVDWVIFDVGGARNQRQAWAPFFDDVNALIFLAPISAFDQVLVEEPDVNRVEDSLLLWRSVVSSKLLKNVNIILFLNKCDLLKKKLAAGITLSRYMTSYGDRPNEYENISKYFRSKFGALHRSYSPNQQRELHIHLTSVTDTSTTPVIISSVRDMILKRCLAESSLL